MRNCDNKLGYKTYEEAEAALMLAKQSGQKSLKIYRCPEEDCKKLGRYHLGHSYED